MLLLGGLGILLDLNSDYYVQQATASTRFIGGAACVPAAALLFVSSGNLLTAILDLGALDVSILLRSTTWPHRRSLSPRLAIRNAVLMMRRT
ncbi:MAG: hypothetical protein R2867_45935 [Caldilineaceae bacterium]